jgi:hypothetical protein
MALSAARFLERLAGRPLVRRLADAGLARYARRRVARLDRGDTVATQNACLMTLVRRARRTRFGYDHDFAGIRSVADYQRRVPLRTYEQFWQGYWQPGFPGLSDVTWPGSIPYFALSSGTTSGSTKYVPVSRQMLASNRKAALTTLALFLAGHPGTPLFAGKAFFLGGSTDLAQLAAGVFGGDLSGIAAREVPAMLRPYTFPPLDLALLRDWDRKMDLLAERSLREPITAVGGVPSWLLLLFERLLQITGKKCVAEAWPALRAVIHGGTKFDPYQALFRRLVGSPDVHFHETYPASEGFIACEDPRHDLLRLLPDLGIFFEFVPVAEVETNAPTRHTIETLETGVQYAIVVTTCAGAWSYVLGDTVCFERREPPLLRFTGRTHYFLSAFGEHLISEEVEKAIAFAATACRAEVVDFHVGPVFPESAAAPGHHLYLVEFARSPGDRVRFAAELDAALVRQNADYAAHRHGDLTMRAPEVYPVTRGGFAAWMRSQGKLGGQHKVPRMDNSGQLTQQLFRFFQQFEFRSESTDSSETPGGSDSNVCSDSVR